MAINVKSRAELEQTLVRVSQQSLLEGVHLELASDDRRVNAIASFLNDAFLPDVPLCLAVGLTYDEPPMKEILRERLRQNLSFILVCNATDEIKGALISHFIEKKNAGSEADVASEARKLLKDFFARKDDEVTVFDKYGVVKAIRIAILSVDGGFRNKGFGSMLLKVALSFYRELDIDPLALQAECLSNVSDSMFEKNDFELMCELPYDDYKVGDKYIFKHLSGCAKIRVKRM